MIFPLLWTLSPTYSGCYNSTCAPVQGLKWMLDREQRGYALERGHLHLHPAWLQLMAADGQLLYISILPPHRITSDFVTAPVGGTCGGAALLLTGIAGLA